MENELADRIRQRLEVLGKSAAAASLEAGLGRSAVTDILSGNSGSPRLITLMRLAKVLECSLAHLIGAEGESAEPARASPKSTAPKMAAVAQLGVFREDNLIMGAFRPISSDRPPLEDDRLPNWTRYPVISGDHSLRNQGIGADDVVFVAFPPEEKEEIILSRGTIVFVKRRVSHEGIFENSFRWVDVRKNSIDLVAGDGDGERRLKIPTENIPDGFEPGKVNYYPTLDGRIRVMGVAMQIAKKLVYLPNE